MKKFFFLFSFVPLTTLAISSTAVGGNETTVKVDVSLRALANVRIEITSASVTWDFNSMAGFPPASFPESFAPTAPPALPHQTIKYRVAGGGGFTFWMLFVEGNGDPFPDCGIALADIEYVEADEAGNETGSWTSFTTFPALIRLGSGNTKGWQELYQNYQVSIDGDETYPTGGTSSCTVTYTIWSLF